MFVRHLVGKASRKLTVPRGVLLGLFIWRFSRFLWACVLISRQQSQQEGSEAEEEPLEDVLLPPTDLLWEMYDEDAVEGLQAASGDPMLMAALMRE